MRAFASISAKSTLEKDNRLRGRLAVRRDLFRGRMEMR